MGTESDVQKVVSLRAFQHKGYWHTSIHVYDEKNDVDEGIDSAIRFNESIPEASNDTDQAWIVLVYAIKQLEFKGAGGRSGGMEFPSLF